MTFSAETIWQPYKPDESPGTNVIKLKNADLKAPFLKTAMYFASLDNEMIRPGGSGEPASVIRAKPNATANDYEVLGAPVPIEQFRGKRVRISAYIKTDSVDAAAGLCMWIKDADENVMAHDNLADHYAVGTSDWTRYDIVTDVPKNAAKIIIQTQIRGGGSVWSDGFEVCVVDDKVPLSDDHTWRSWSPRPAEYQTTLDKTVQLNGKPTICMSSDPGARTYNAYDRSIYDIDQYRGKRVRLTAMVKCQGVTGGSGPLMRAVGRDFATIKMDDHRGKREVRGTCDWAPYSVTIDVPKEAVAISYGVELTGRGTLWFTDLQLEVLDK
jgi:hypothetical protein